ncbi:Transcriptional regulator, AraC family [Acidisarcina polymorpha]|uniref:Transcriptional regulator, AraC family n=2 Tax=Acidisarcina polymorpha TaxID=2211140 RepID=A0A2Z5GAG6_9BACT|nr:Transcriptional regulator, AraC family [Acidisarcina polymorpha]
MPINVTLLALPSASLMNIFGPAEVFDQVNDHLGKTVYQVQILPAGLQRRACEGMETELDVADLSQCTHSTDTLLLAGGLEWPVPLPRKQMSGLAGWIRLCSTRIRRIGGLSSGGLVLAEAGILNGKRATTHWSYAERMAKSFSQIRVLSDRIFVRDGVCYTAAGGTSAIDLALSLVEEDIGEEAAINVAKHMVLFLRRSGAQPQLSTTLLAQTSAARSISNLLFWIADNLDHDLSVSELAKRVAMSPRNFVRHFTRTVGKTPGRHVTELRLEAACQHLASPSLSLFEVAKASGFGSVEAFRRPFTKTFGIPPGKYRIQSKERGCTGAPPATSNGYRLGWT